MNHHGGGGENVLEARDGQPVSGHRNSLLHVHGDLASLLLEDIEHCTIHLHCFPQQIRLFRCSNCRVVGGVGGGGGGAATQHHQENARYIAVALEACQEIIFSGTGWRRPIQDFTPNHHHHHRHKCEGFSYRIED